MQGAGTADALKYIDVTTSIVLRPLIDVHTNILWPEVVEGGATSIRCLYGQLIVIARGRSTNIFFAIPH